MQACSVKIGFDNTYPVDSDLSREYIAPSIFQQLGLGVNLDKIKTFWFSASVSIPSGDPIILCKHGINWIGIGILWIRMPSSFLEWLSKISELHFVGFVNFIRKSNWFQCKLDTKIFELEDSLFITLRRWADTPAGLFCEPAISEFIDIYHQSW